MNTEAIIVTGFFDIGRDSYAGAFKRSPDDYFEAFKVWSQLQNIIVVFTYADMAERIIALGRKNIHTIVRDFNAEKEQSLVYPMMIEIEESSFFKEKRKKLSEDSPENKADYNFAVSLKPSFMKEAKGMYLDSRYFVWMDFGFNHKKSCQYPIEEEFNTEIVVSHLKEKGYFFGHHLNKLSHATINSLIEEPGEIIMGGFYVLRADAIERFYLLYRDIEEELLDKGLMDDDQTILTLLIQKDPGFKVFSSNWCLGLKQIGCDITSYSDISKFPEIL